MNSDLPKSPHHIYEWFWLVCLSAVLSVIHSAAAVLECINIIYISVFNRMDLVGI